MALFLLLVDGEEKGEMHNEPQKLTAGTLAVFAAAALLAGCGGEKKTEKAPEEKKKIVVGITPGYSEEIMEFVKDEAKNRALMWS